MTSKISEMVNSSKLSKVNALTFAFFLHPEKALSLMLCVTVMMFC